MTAETPPNFTSVTPEKPVPVMKTVSPTRPLAGEKEETVGPPEFGVTEAHVVPTRMLPRRRVGAAVELPWRRTTESIFAWSLPAELVMVAETSDDPSGGLTQRLATSSVVVAAKR